MYIDDMRMSLTFDIAPDFLKPYLEVLGAWTSVNLLSTNLCKCKKLSFSRSSPMRRGYSIFGEIIEDVPYFIDLGIVFDRELRLHVYIIYYSEVRQSVRLSVTHSSFNYY